MIPKDQIKKIKNATKDQLKKDTKSRYFFISFFYKARSFISNLSFQQKYYLVGILLANLPDIDTMVTNF
jgi:hypothetical protein